MPMPVTPYGLVRLGGSRPVLIAHVDSNSLAHARALAEWLTKTATDGVTFEVKRKRVAMVGGGDGCDLQEKSG